MQFLTIKAYLSWINNYKDNKWVNGGLHDEHNKRIIMGKSMMRSIMDITSSYKCSGGIDVVGLRMIAENLGQCDP